MTTGSEGLLALLDVIEAQTGTDYRGFRPELLSECLRDFAAGAGLGGDAVELAARVALDGTLLDGLVRALVRPRLPLFGDPRFWQALRELVVPLLRTYPFIHVWVPGCGDGHEAFATAIMLADEGLGERAQVWATEVADAALARARIGLLDGTPEEQEVAYLAAGGRSPIDSYRVVDANGRATLAPALLGRVLFAQHNLATDGSFHEFQLILCRGVLGALRPPLARRAHEVLRTSLCRLGILALAPDEAPVAVTGATWEGFSPEWALYRRT